jgi:hypothetical protein
VSHPPYSEISPRKRDVHFSEAPLNLVVSGLILARALRIASADIELAATAFGESDLAPD